MAKENPPSSGKDASDASARKQWKKEIKRRLRREALQEIRPLAVGTLAMIGSALCNQGKSGVCLDFSSLFVSFRFTFFILCSKIDAVSPTTYLLSPIPNETKHIQYHSGPTPPWQGIGWPHDLLLFADLCQWHVHSIAI